MSDRSLSKVRFLIVGIAVSDLLHLSDSLSVARTMRSAIATIRTQPFDCIIVERELEDGDGLVLAPIIQRIQPKSISILLSNSAQWATLEAARHLGYSEVIDRKLPIDRIVSHICLLLAETPMKKEALPSSSKIHLLSLREREILSDIATGATTEEIAKMRHNSVATIKSHLSSIYRKLDVRNRVEAITTLRQF